MKTRAGNTKEQVSANEKYFTSSTDTVSTNEGYFGSSTSTTRSYSSEYIVRNGYRFKNGKHYDPVEETRQYKEIEKEANDLIDQEMMPLKGKLGYAYYYPRKKQQVLKERFGIEWCSEVKVSRRTVGRHSELYDAIGDTPEYKAIETELEQKIELRTSGDQKGMGYCHVYWRIKKEILKRDYNIDWCCPAELNESIMYD